ncbi:MAG: hypothetical protein ACI9VR_004588 [Cognaticolwellia sp.]|jgi:hypothetical protein
MLKPNQAGMSQGPMIPLCFHPWVDNSALDPVVTEVTVLPLPGQAALTLLPGFALPEESLLDLGGLKLERQWTDRRAPSSALNYREPPDSVHVPISAIQAELAHCVPRQSVCRHGAARTDSRLTPGARERCYGSIHADSPAGVCAYFHHAR